MSPPIRYDVIIVGAGPAGLSAALLLGRCRRKVLVCDTGRPRNRASRALHGFLSRDGASPADLLQISREQLAHYDTVELRQIEVTDAARTTTCFRIGLSDGSSLLSRTVLLATGVIDLLPEVSGIDHFFGTSVFTCPYCDAWELRGQPLAVYGRGEKGSGLALMLTLWSDDLVLCTDGPSDLSEENLARLAAHKIPIREERIARLEGSDGRLEKIIFLSGDPLSRRAMFFNTGQYQGSPLAAKLGCEVTDSGGVKTGDYGQSSTTPGLYIVGDATRDVQFAIVAAAEAAEAACAINKALLKADNVT
jgi:thioredoxin reductase